MLMKTVLKSAVTWAVLIALRMSSGGLKWSPSWRCFPGPIRDLFTFGNDLSVLYWEHFRVRRCYCCLCWAKPSTLPKQIGAAVQPAREAEAFLSGTVPSLSHRTDCREPPCRVRVGRDGSFWLQVWGMGKKKFTVKADKYTYSEFPV